MQLWVKGHHVHAYQGLMKREGQRACNSHSDSIDGEIKSVTKNSNTKTWTFSLLGVLGKYTENSKISPSLVLLKIVFAIE